MGGPSPSPSLEPCAEGSSPSSSVPGTRVRAALASAFGLGLSPVLPGTCAALLGLGVHYLLALALPPTGVAVGLALALAVSVVLNRALTEFSVRHWGSADPCEFVWDEIAGYLATALLIFHLPWWPFAPLGFVLFRFIDMVKVWPASVIDRRWHGPWGIVMDDFVSAVYAAGLVHVAAWQDWIG